MNHHTAFRKVLIANRGEIACRIMRTLRSMGIGSIAVYSEADRQAAHVTLADEAVCIGPAPAAASYLSIPALISAARACGADAIHPGYGFLSENPLLAEACVDNGIVFIGPPASAIRAMGSKSAAKRLMESAGVPLIPGYHGEDQSTPRLISEAQKIGFPVLLKAALGGGGKGMRVVESAATLEDAIASCRREAKASFADDTLLIEKYIARPRHVEVQVFCDQQGNAVHLFERDCSIQRRHQKIIEESPAPDLPEPVRNAMTRDAIIAARSIDYVGAGTVEFLFDGADQYFFMEMNTRLQVEHPVTEMVTGEDLVEWQIRVAEGGNLPKSQQDISIKGHAIEARICAENPALDFMPSTGRLVIASKPAESKYVRIDSGVNDTDSIPVYYDPMFAKLITWDENRSKAINRMRQALEQFCVSGVETNIHYLHQLVSLPAFAQKQLATDFIGRHQSGLLPAQPNQAEYFIAAALFEYLAATTAPASDPWDSKSGWSLNAVPVVAYRYMADETVHSVELSADGPGLRVSHQGHLYKVWARLDQRRLSVTGDIHFSAIVQPEDNAIAVFHRSRKIRVLAASQLGISSQDDSHHKLTSPMPGIIANIMVATGDSISKNQPLLILEAMKMEHVIRADKDGTVVAILCEKGETVAANKVLVDIQ